MTQAILTPDNAAERRTPWWNSSEAKAVRRQKSRGSVLDWRLRFVWIQSGAASAVNKFRSRSPLPNMAKWDSSSLYFTIKSHKKQGGMMFCCAEMRCWRKMMCRCAAMEGESSQGELFAKLQASSPSQSSRAARCQLSQRESPWHDGKLSGSNAKCAVSPRGCFRRKPARQLPLSSTTPPVKMR